MAHLQTCCNRSMSYIGVPELNVAEVPQEWSITSRVNHLSLDPVTMLLLMQPRMWLIFWVAGAQCQLMLSFSLTNTSKSFLSALTQFIPKSTLIFGISPIQVQDHTLSLVKLHIYMGPPFKPYHQLQNISWCWQQTCWRCTQSHCPCH